jgi:hypothetical protein
MPMLTFEDVFARGAAQLATQAANCKLYGDYYDGVHPLVLASEKFRTAFGTLFRKFADNLTPSVVDAVADRLRLVGFEVTDGPAAGADAAWDVWKRNRMDRVAGNVHAEAVKVGDCFVLVWPDAVTGRAVIYPQSAAVMTVGYSAADGSAGGAPAWGMKMWTSSGSEKRVRLTLYFPDRLEKYISKNTVTEGSALTSAAAFEPYQPEGEPWPIPNPYGRVPVFHFANNSGLGSWGKSELLDVLPLQNALNKSVLDMLVASEYYSLPQRWATGIEISIDEDTGLPKPPFKVGVDTLWIADAEAKFGEFAQADLTNLIAVSDSIRTEIARVSRTPVHYMIPGTGTPPSGESLKVAEAPFVAKIRDRQVAFGNDWEDVAAFALLIQGTKDVQLSALWTSAEPRSEAEDLANAVMRKSVGVPQSQIWSELGYSADQIAKFEEEVKAATAAANDAMLAALDRGAGAGAGFGAGGV